MNLLSRKRRTKSGSGRGQQQPQPQPQLDRRNAKHYEYDAASSSSSSLDVSTLSSSSLHMRSLHSVDPTSFRIDGDQGDQLELIINRLGLSSVEDLSIPLPDWLSRRISSDLQRKPVCNRLFSPRDEEKAKNDRVAPDRAVDETAGSETWESDKKDRYREVVAPAIDLRGTNLTESTRCWPGTANESAQSDPNELRMVIDMVERLEESTQLSGEVMKEVRVAPELNKNESIEVKGIRQPELKPPPSIKVPDIDIRVSTWDLIRDLAPPFVYGQEVEKGDMEEEEEDDGWPKFRETGGLSSPCSFTTTSNDEDYSSISTEPKSNYVSPNGKPKKIITTWEKCGLLGRGSFGSVYEALSHDGSFFAVKEVSLLDQGPAGMQKILQLEHEIALLSRFEHENIVQYYGTDKDDSNLYIFLEIMKSSLVSTYKKYCLGDSQVSAYTRQILNGLKYLHDQAVVHRDIKCANILVDASGSVKLADFGLAKATKLNDIKSCKGTAFWMAPEVVKANNHGGYGCPADIWSLGCTVLEMFTREVPYYQFESMAAVYRIGKGMPPAVPDTLSHDARDFILKCLQVKPEDRPTAAELLGHPFVVRPPPLTTSASDESALHLC